MKKTFKFAALALCAVAFATSCGKNDIEVNVAPAGEKLTFTCLLADEGTKLGISDAGKVTWEAGDEILFHGKWAGGNYSSTVTLTAENISQDGKKATVKVDDFNKGTVSGDQASNIYAIYPASAVATDNGNSNWRSLHKFNNSNLPLMVGYNKEADGKEFVFRNLCGIISFSVSGEFDTYEFAGNNDETVGYDGYQAELYWTTDGAEKSNYVKAGTPMKKISGALNADGSTVHYICVPGGVSFSGGFTLTFKDGSDIKKVAVSKTAVEVPRNKMLILGNITSKLENYEAPVTSDHKSAITGATDLSADGAANCYIVTKAGNYKLPVVKGNDKDQNAGVVFGVEIVWETWNNTEEVTENSVIAAVDYDGPENYVYFSVPDPIKPGNALIAAKDNQDNIIWSWHIWVPATDITLVDYTESVKMMSRNLGALTDADGVNAATAESCGFLYQWGRKDPFMGVGEMKANSSTKATVTKAFAAKSDEPVTMAYSIAHPTVFAYNAATSAAPDYAGQSWCSDDNDTAWNNNGAKGLYDPCPAGYKVPLRDANVSFWTKEAWTLNLENFFYSAGSIVCPYAGYLDDCGGSLAHGGDRSAIWSATGSGMRGKSIDVRSSVDASKDQYKARGNSVRCVVE